MHLDLSSDVQYIVALALVALSEICTADMCKYLFKKKLKKKF